MAPGDNIFLNLESLLEFRQKIMDGKYPSLKRSATMIGMLDERIDVLQKECAEAMRYVIGDLNNGIMTINL